MPSLNGIIATVRINGIQLDEYPHKSGKLFIKSDMDIPGISYEKTFTENFSYGLEESTWTVTPYTIHVQNNTSKDVLCKVSIDGREVKKSRLVIRAGKSNEFKGFKDDNNDIREFLFAPPRFKKESEFGKKIDEKTLTLAGTIQVFANEAIKTHTNTEYVQQSARSNDAEVEFNHINKYQANQAQLNQGFGKCGTTTPGRIIESDTVNGGYYSKFDYFTEGRSVAELIVHYREPHVLEKLNLIPTPAPRCEPKQTGSSSKDTNPSNTNLKRKREDEDEDEDEIDELIDLTEIK